MKPDTHVTDLEKINTYYHPVQYTLDKPPIPGLVIRPNRVQEGKTTVPISWRLWLMGPAPMHMMRAAISWCNFKGKGLVSSSWQTSLTRCQATPGTSHTNVPAFGFRGTVLDCKGPWTPRGLSVSSTLGLLWGRGGGKEGRSKTGGVGRSGQPPLSIPTAALLDLMHCPREAAPDAGRGHRFGSRSPWKHISRVLLPNFIPTPLTCYLLCYQTFPGTFLRYKSRKQCFKLWNSLTNSEVHYVKQIGHLLRLYKNSLGC